MWHVLDAGSIWIKEFASALSQRAETVAWSPRMSLTGAWQRWERVVQLGCPALEVREFPLQRGYARSPISRLLDYGGMLADRLAGRGAADAPLICTTPFYAPVAEKWRGPVVYYLTDLTVGYEGIDPRLVRALDRRMCRVAASVCPNSQRIANYLTQSVECDPRKITLVPNATRDENVAQEPLLHAGKLPEDVSHTARPVAGVIGNLAGNLDWVLLAEVIERTPWLSWVFVGPFDGAIRDAAHHRSRERLLAMGGRIRFTGSRTYGRLQHYARAFDVAILPYLKKEPTYSGSSTRFYEHLAACRPMLATRGFEELLHKQPYLQLCNTACEMTSALHRLRNCNFQDGQERARWMQSREEVWGKRAEALTATLCSNTVSTGFAQ